MNREQSQSALPCHHVISVASIAATPTPGRESARASYLQETMCQSNCTRVASSLGDNVVDHMVCLKSWLLWHTGLSNENCGFYRYDIHPYLNRSVCLLMGSPTWWGFSFCLSPGHTCTATCRRLPCDWKTAATNATTVRSKTAFFGCRSIGDWSATSIPKIRRPVGDRSATGGRLIANSLEMGCNWSTTGRQLVGYYWSATGRRGVGDWLLIKQFAVYV